MSEESTDRVHQIYKLREAGLSTAIVEILIGLLGAYAFYWGFQKATWLIGDYIFKVPLDSSAQVANWGFAIIVFGFLVLGLTALVVLVPLFLVYGIGEAAFVIRNWGSTDDE